MKKELKCNDWSCPYWKSGWCQLDNPEEECDEVFIYEEEEE